jgi:lysophospholipase L1-like esterase
MICRVFGVAVLLSSLSNTAMGGAPLGTLASACVDKTGPIQVMVIGDSITAGGYGDGNQRADPQRRFHDSYRYELWRLLKEANVPSFVFSGHVGQRMSWGMSWGGDLPAGSTDREFSHSGVGGITVEGALAQLDTFLAGPKGGHATNPDVVLVNLGTNIKARPVPYATLIDAIKAKAPQAQLVLGTMPLTGAEIKRASVTGERAKLRAEILAIGNASPSDRIVSVDVYNRLRSGASPLAESDLADGLHMRISGGVKYGAALAPETVDAVRAAAQQRCGGTVVEPSAMPEATSAGLAPVVEAPTTTRSPTRVPVRTGCVGSKCRSSK